jgi:multidrug efflux pump subunit AcrA (membrane-fusion protein)
VRIGAEAIMSSDAYPGRTFKGRVTEVTPGGNPDQRAFRVRIIPDGASTLPVGLTLEINIVTSTKDRALLAPATAVRAGKLWIADDGEARQVAVRTGVEGADKTEIVSGIPRGACIIDSPPDEIAEGRRVRVSGC